MKEYLFAGILGIGLSALLIKIFYKQIDALTWKTAEMCIEHKRVKKAKKEAALREHLLLQNEFRRIREKYAII